MIIDVVDEAEQRHNRYVCITLIKHLIRIVRDEDAGLQAEPCEITDVHAHHRRVDIDRTHDLRAMLIQIADDVLRHLTTAILNDLYLLHIFLLFRPCGSHQTRTFLIAPL